MIILVILFIAVSLSLDAFSLSLAYGTYNFSRSKCLKLSLLVGVFHYIMPLIGMLIGEKIFKYIFIAPHVLVFIILFFLGISMIIESISKTEKNKDIKINYLLFPIAVSLDSLSVGVGINVITAHPFISFIFFSMFSFLATYLGLWIGKKVNETVGKISNMIGGIILLILAIIYLI